MKTGIGGSMYDFMNIKESDPKYDIKNLTAGSEASKEIFNKAVSIYESWARFWSERISVGKKCMNFMRREIFTAKQRGFYVNVQEKIPVEPQEMKPVIDALVGQVSQTVRSSTVTMEDGDPPETVARPETVAKVLKWWQNRLKIKRTSDLILRDGLITGYPVWIWFDKTPIPGGGPGEAKATRLRWDSTLSFPHFEKEDGSDIKEVIRLYDRDYDEMYRMFPERKAEHKRHLDLINDRDFQKNYWQLDQSTSSSDRNNTIYNRISSATHDAMLGKCLVIERYHPVYDEVECFVNEATNDIQVIPPDWPEWKYDAWKNAHPEYDLRVTDEIPTLWMTTVSSDGFIWENKRHWYQENGNLPGICYIADMVDNITTGKGDDMIPYVLQIAVCETEGLAQVRTGTGTISAVVESALKHPSRFEKEMSKENGVLVFKKGTNIDQEFKTIQRKPNDTYHVMADRARDQLKEAHAVNDTVMGISNPRQSNRSKETDLQSGLNPQSPYVLNFAEFNLNLAQLMVNMMPYCLTEEQIIQIEDEWGTKEKPETVNQVGYNNETGEAEIIANDLTAIPYRVVAVPGDDSNTTREKELKEFVSLLEAVGNTLFQIDPKVLATIFRGWPNYFARQAGQSLMQFAEQNQVQQQQSVMAEQEAKIAEAETKARVEMEKIKKPRFNIRLSPTDLKEAPIGTQLFINMLNSINAPQDIPQEPDQVQPDMAAMEQGQPQGSPMEQMAV